MFALYADFLGKDKFGKGGTVHPETFFCQQLHNDRIGAGFDGEIFTESRIPSEERGEFPGIGEHGGLVVNVKGCRVAFDDILNLPEGERNVLVCHKRTVVLE